MSQRWWILGVLIMVAAGVFLTVLSTSLEPQTNPVMRGWELAEDMGCFSCHGSGGFGGVNNPGSEEGEIPAWDGGMLMMYVENQDEIREWILYGKPKRMSPNSGEAETSDPSHQHDIGEVNGPVEMPAFEKNLTDEEVNDLVAYIRVIGAYNLPEKSPSVRKGFAVAESLGCFGCHRQGGLIGTPNPGSLKGYIPPWNGPDFEELVRSDSELSEWIRNGKIQRFESNPLARFFSGRQVIQMPAYGSRLKEGELDSLIDYIQWLDGLDFNRGAF